MGCALPGLWLLRLAPLDPILTVIPVDFAARQRQEAASVPDDRKSDAEKRRAILPLPVYVEESVQYNVFPAAGPQWDRFLAEIDRLDAGEAAGASRYAFFRSDAEPIREVLDKLAEGGGTTFVSISRPGSDRHYEVDRRIWSRRDFRAGAGFTGQPAPPARLLYPFRTVGLVLLLAGAVFFALLPGPRRPGFRPGPSRFETAALAGALVLFALPVVAVGGSVQAITRAPWLTIPCWFLTAAGVHLFAGPRRNAPDAPESERGTLSPLFLREGLVFLAMALGPLAFLVSASMTLWNR
ncbi:MAG TPA: hypothetical protein VIZ58_02050 [Thermoanaerobaculia bacterium]